ncbi:MAG: NUDIX hydrolase [Bacillota bacterium]
MRIAINALCIRANQVLLLRKKETWILPGGKPEPGEYDFSCLIREQQEEMPHAAIDLGELYGEFTGTTPHSGTALTARVYFADILGDITPAREIAEARFFSRNELPGLHISDITRKILDHAVDTGHLV